MRRTAGGPPSLGKMVTSPVYFCLMAIDFKSEPYLFVTVGVC